MIIFLVCLIVILLIFVLNRNIETFEIDNDINNLKYIVETSRFVIIKETEELHKCLYSKCRIVYKEAHELIGKKMDELVKQYIPRVLFLVRMMINSKDMNKKEIINNNIQLDSTSLHMLLESILNNKDITPVIVNILYIFNLEMKSFVSDFKKSMDELFKTNILKNYSTCLCNNCEDIEIKIEVIFNKISKVVINLKKEITNILTRNNSNTTYYSVLNNIFDNWVDLFEYVRLSTKDKIDNCHNTKLLDTPSYCGPPLFPLSNITTFNNRNIYNPGNFVVSQTNKFNIENSNLDSPIQMYGNININREALF